jgi:hypothetical protein
MKGRYHIVVQNNRVRYELDIKRNITIIRGDSATGKTTLIQMLESAYSLGESSGIEVVCEKTCRTLGGKDWDIVMANIHDQIVFIDEENNFIKSQEFAVAVKNSDNYYVIVTREDLPNLPYSVEEIYGIHTSGKYHNMNRYFNEMHKIYGSDNKTNVGKQGYLYDWRMANDSYSADYDIAKSDIPQSIVVEDSNSGFEFFRALLGNTEIECISAVGKSNIKGVLSNSGDKNILAIADGAAIGSEMNELYQYMQHHHNVKLYLPESFEWIVLKSGLIDGRTLQEVLERPEDYIDGKIYLSWERYFTALLVEYTKDSYLKYNKSKLNTVYLHEKNKKAILDVIKESVELPLNHSD